MDQEIILPEWRNNNQHTRYPFSDDATLVNVDGQSIAEDLFDDARIYPVGGSVGLFLRRVEITPLGLFFHISDPVAGEIASGGYLFNNPVPNEIGLFDQYGRPAGVLVSDSTRLQNAAGVYPQGDTIFEQAQTEFAPTVAIPIPNNDLRGVLLDDGGFIAGDVYLVGANGIVLRLDNGAIRVDVIGDPYALLKSCQDEGFVTPPFCGLKTINGISPDANGDFKLTIGGNLAQANILRIIQDAVGDIDITALGALG